MLEAVNTDLVFHHQPEAQHPKSSAIHKLPADYPIYAAGLADQYRALAKELAALQPDVLRASYISLPNARIIRACRDLRDTAFSCFSLLFARDDRFHESCQLS